MSETPTQRQNTEPAKPPRLSLRRSPGRILPRGLIRILVLCLIVGLVLSMLGIGPEDFWRFIWSALTGIYNWLVGISGSLGAYVVIGACVVIPIVGIRRLWRRATR